MAKKNKPVASDEVTELEHLARQVAKLSSPSYQVDLAIYATVYGYKVEVNKNLNHPRQATSLLRKEGTSVWKPAFGEYQDRNWLPFFTNDTRPVRNIILPDGWIYRIQEGAVVDGKLRSDLACAMAIYHDYDGPGEKPFIKWTVAQTMELALCTVALRALDLHEHLAFEKNRAQEKETVIEAPKTGLSEADQDALDAIAAHQAAVAAENVVMH